MTTTSLSPEDHVAIIQELFTLDETVFQDLKKISNNRSDLAKKMLSLMASTEIAKKKNLTNVDSLKTACLATKKHADVIGAQGMFCSIAGITAPPIMLGVFWLL
jgi:hypothetical protein